MPSQLKSDTARANGAKSKGPKTAETREKSSRNSLKHGYTARHNMLLACEDPALFQQVVDEYTTFYQPANPVERDLVEEIIGAKWRIRRLKTIEVALVDYEMDSKLEEIQQKLSKFDSGIHLGISFKGLADESRSAALLSRYESRLHRIFHRSHEAFMDLRRDIAAGLIGQPPTPMAPEPPAPSPVTETSPSDTSASAPVADNSQQLTAVGPPPATHTHHSSPLPRKRFRNEPSLRVVLRKIRNHQPLNDAFRRSKNGLAQVAQGRSQFKNAS